MGDVDVVAESGTGVLSSSAWAAVAESAGTPFHAGCFLRTWWNDRHAKCASSQLIGVRVVDGELPVGICAFELSAGGVLSFAGGHDVVDYMGPVAIPGREKEVAAALTRWMFDSGSRWTRLDLAGLSHDSGASQALIDEVTRTAPDAVIEPYDKAPRIEAAPQGYLALLNSKKRSDILRKRNRLVEAFGELEVVDSTPDTVPESLERLLAWKSAASAETGEFVADYGDFVRKMVTELSAADTGHVVELRAAGRPLAAAITLQHRDTTYIYNMSYDMTLSAGDQAGLAPGVVLVSMLVERSLDLGQRFDFLKGAQDYKLRLGGIPVDLIGISAGISSRNAEQD